MKVNKIHCLQCGTEVVPDENGDVVRFCRFCRFDFKSLSKKNPSSNREPWVNYCMCGAKGFESAPRCIECGTDLSSLTIKKISKSSSPGSQKIALASYTAIFGVQLLPDLLDSDLVDGAGGFFKGIVKGIWDVFS